MNEYCVWSDNCTLFRNRGRDVTQERLYLKPEYLPSEQRCIPSMQVNYEFFEWAVANIICRTEITEIIHVDFEEATLRSGILYSSDCLKMGIIWGNISAVYIDFKKAYDSVWREISLNPLNAELNPICYLLALLAYHFLHVSRIRVKSLNLRLLMSYIYIYIYIYTWSTYSWCF